MLAWFPRPYPDESVYSLIARYHECSGNVRLRDTLGQLFQAKRQSSSVFVPYRLGCLAEAAAPFGLGFDTLLREHTLFDYYMLFSKEENRQTVRRILQTNASENYEPYMNLYEQNEIPASLRFCPACMNEERRKYGEAYWHNLHQAPGMLCCEKHGCPLVISTVSSKRHKIANYIPAETMQFCQMPRLDERTALRLRALAEDIAFLWENREKIRQMWERCGGSFANHFLFFASEKGLASPGLTLHRERFLSTFEAWISKEALERLDLAMEGVHKPWLFTICQRNRTPWNPAKAVLLAEFLCGSFPAFIRRIEGMEEVPKPKQSVVYAQITDLEQLTPRRDKWLELLARSPAATRNQLIQLAPADHLWLRRHDADWLYAHCPPAIPRGGTVTVCGWAARDEQCLAKIRRLYRSFSRETCRPVRITKNRFYHPLGLNGSLRDKMPKSFALIASFTETAEQWNLRRIRWAVRETEQNGEPLIPWIIARKAGLAEKYRKQYTMYLNELCQSAGKQNTAQEACCNEI